MAGILSYALKLDTAGFTSPLRDANAKLGGLKLSAGSGSGGLAGLSATAAGATAVFTAFGAAVASSLGVLRSYAEFDGLVRGLKTLDGTSEATAARLERLRDVAKVPGLGFEEAVRGDIKLRAWSRLRRRGNSHTSNCDFLHECNIVLQRRTCVCRCQSGHLPD